MDLITEIVVWVTAIIGGASLVVQGIAKITAITPSTKDDALVGKATRWIAYLQKFLDRLALNPSAKDARKK